MFCISFGILCSICTFIKSADAHKVNIYAYAENGKVHAEGYFVDGSKCKNSLIEVVDNKTGEKLLEGNTDDNGKFSFVIPRATSVKLILRAGMGHQNEYILTEEEIREAMPQAEQKRAKQTEKQAVPGKGTAPEPIPQKKEQPAGVQNLTNIPYVTSQDIEAIIEKVIDNKLQPVMRILVKLQEKSEKPGLTEIIGGVGYIIGIMGVIAYFKGRSAGRNSRS